MKKVRDYLKHYRVTKGSTFRLRDVDPGDTRDLDSREQAQQWLKEGVEQISTLQERLYADNRWALLLIFQAMDAAGKDSTIKHVMSGVNPMGCQVYAFKEPSSEELDHDFLWRTSRCLPERGRIGIFNRSYYEETLVVRVHPEFLEKQRLPSRLVTKHIWDERFEDIRAFERYVGRNGVAVCKFFLHVSKEEQKKRFLKRLDEPAKNWKFSLNDAKERGLWGKYMRAYEDMIRNTSAPDAPWYVVPADHKWFTRLIVAAAVVDALERLHLSFPTLSREKRKELAATRAAL